MKSDSQLHPWTAPHLPAKRRQWTPVFLACCLCAPLMVAVPARAEEPAAQTPPADAPFVDARAPAKKKMDKSSPDDLPTATPKEMADKVREALGATSNPNRKLTLVINGEPVATAAPPAVAPRAAMRPRTVAMRGDGDWSYDGANGPANWARLSAANGMCAMGKRQSPINIQDDQTLQGPAEPVQFNYVSSNATVINNGHTIVVEVQGENAITVRGTTYRLSTIEFHAPSEEQINSKRAAMVAHLIHKSDEGQYAIVAIQMEPGKPNELIDKVWTYMPLDISDRVHMPPELLNLNELLPLDQRYYQFVGSLTTPPCSEGVLWIVMKQPMQISKMQYRLFTQLYPANARPVQPVNGRPVRSAQ